METTNSTNDAVALTVRQSHSQDGSNTTISLNPGNGNRVSTAEPSIPLTPIDPRFATERPLLQDKAAETLLPAVRKEKGKFNSWWWWEIASASLSVICMILLLVLLLQVDSRPLESWKLPIQVNSVVAVFTTVAKTSMMVPVAACLSQLKWRHYLRRSDRLINLQFFDDASRGPWGSAMLLLSLRRRAILSWAFAFLTVVALGIDPSAQQILDFPSREAELGNVTAILGRAENYDAKAYVQGKFTNSLVPNSDLLKLQASIINGLSGQVFQPTLECPSPATACSWPEVRTMGICSTVEDVTALTTANCTGSTFGQLNCTYTFPDYADQLEPLEMTYNKQEQTSAPASSLFLSTSATSFAKASGQFLAFAAVKVTENSMPGNTTPPSTRTYRASLFWCELTFSSPRAGPSGLSASSRQPTSTGPMRIAEVNSTSIIYTAGASEENAGPRNYTVTKIFSEDLWAYLGVGLLSRSVIAHPLAAKPSSQVLDIASFLYAADLETALTNLAATLTNQMRSVEPGDNTKAQQVRGTAFFSETYIHVRWGWLVLPMAEIMLVAALLVAVIVATRHETLVKESVVAYFVYGTDAMMREGLEANNTAVAMSGDEMAEAAKGVDVKLVKDGNGALRLCRA